MSSAANRGWPRRDRDDRPIGDHDARRALAELQAEVWKALYVTPLGEVMGRGVMAEDVPHIVALLRAKEAAT